MLSATVHTKLTVTNYIHPCILHASYLVYNTLHIYIYNIITYLFLFLLFYIVLYYIILNYIIFI